MVDHKLKADRMLVATHQRAAIHNLSVLLDKMEAVQHILAVHKVLHLARKEPKRIHPQSKASVDLRLY